MGRRLGRWLVLWALVLGGTAAEAQTVQPSAPRAPDGHADLSGTWTNASLTRLTRRKGVAKLVVTPEEAAALAKADPLARSVAEDAGPSKVSDQVDDGQPFKGYNGFWLEPGDSLARVNGEFRTSWIVDPEDGQLPLSAAGRALIARTETENRTDFAENPEALAPWDRCLISSRGAGGPGMLNTIYNSNYQIVQTPGWVTILVEQVHDARMVRVFPSKAEAVRGHGAHPRWLGDSVGWWEGDTFVVETTNVHPRQGERGPIFLTPQGKVTERLTRVSADQIFYAFEVEDPAYYSRPWRAEMSLNATPHPIYEFACHEGNYAMTGVLAGARAEEAKGPAGAPASRGGEDGQ